MCIATPITEISISAVGVGKAKFYVNEETTVHELKAQVEKSSFCPKIRLRHMRLKFRGKLLKDNDTLAASGITEHSLLTLAGKVSSDPNTRLVWVKNAHDKEPLAWQVDLKKTCKEAARLAAVACGYEVRPDKKCGLMFKGKLLPDDKPLNRCGVEMGSVVRLNVLVFI
mmetsp:Transcript_146492/g.255515  ORF Transcript_146492/g.255515 Transcript_146492/m.255515 type:complete len:169 (-) Transcript_146492:459-965(-)